MKVAVTTVPNASLTTLNQYAFWKAMETKAKQELSKLKNPVLEIICTGKAITIDLDPDAEFDVSLEMPETVEFKYSTRKTYDYSEFSEYEVLKAQVKVLEAEFKPELTPRVTDIITCTFK